MIEHVWGKSAKKWVRVYRFVTTTVIQAQSKSTGGKKSTRLGGCPMMYIPVDGIEGRCFYLSEPNGNRYTFFEAKEECEKELGFLGLPIIAPHYGIFKGRVGVGYLTTKLKTFRCDPRPLWSDHLCRTRWRCGTQNTWSGKPLRAAEQMVTRLPNIDYSTTDLILNLIHLQ